MRNGKEGRDRQNDTHTHKEMLMHIDICHIGQGGGEGAGVVGGDVTRRAGRRRKPKRMGYFLDSKR